eukprot:2652175-Prymnesium_polylepis.1
MGAVEAFAQCVRLCGGGQRARDGFAVCVRCACGACGVRAVCVRCACGVRAGCCAAFSMRQRTGQSRKGWPHTLSQTCREHASRGHELHSNGPPWRLSLADGRCCRQR